MSVVVGLVCDDGSVIIGSEEQARRGYVRVKCHRKTVRNGRAMVGYAGTTLLEQCLECAAAAPALVCPDDYDGVLGWVERLAEFVVGWLRHREHGKVGEDGIWTFQGDLLVAVPGLRNGDQGRMWTIDCSGCVMPSLEGYAALGSGAEVAYGALYVSVDILRCKTVAAVEAAILGAVRFSQGCGGAASVVQLYPGGCESMLAATTRVLQSEIAEGAVLVRAGMVLEGLVDDEELDAMSYAQVVEAIQEVRNDAEAFRAERASQDVPEMPRPPMPRTKSPAGADDALLRELDELIPSPVPPPAELDLSAFSEDDCPF